MWEKTINIIVGYRSEFHSHSYISSHKLTNNWTRLHFTDLQNKWEKKIVDDVYPSSTTYLFLQLTPNT